MGSVAGVPPCHLYLAFVNTKMSTICPNWWWIFGNNSNSFLLWRYQMAATNLTFRWSCKRYNQHTWGNSVHVRIWSTRWHIFLVRSWGTVGDGSRPYSVTCSVRSLCCWAWYLYLKWIQNVSSQSHYQYILNGCNMSTTQFLDVAS